MIEKDRVSKDLKDIAQIKLAMEKKMSQTVVSLRAQLADVHEKLKIKSDDYVEVFEQLYQKEKICKGFVDEARKMKNRIAQLKKKKGHFEQSKICKSCLKDFDDSNNFNWSCRTHHSQFSGELWWCCGKTNVDALGCKFARH